nr:MAG TPA: hypothetical protein [Caudoviricetes sp.]
MINADIRSFYAIYAVVGAVLVRFMPFFLI